MNKNNNMTVFDLIKERVFDSITESEKQIESSVNSEEKAYNEAYNKNLIRVWTNFERALPSPTDANVGKWFLTNTDLIKSQKERIKSVTSGGLDSVSRANLNSSVDFYSAIEMVFINRPIEE